MNIFEVLSQGKSRLHEPSMSAMLGYLLDSNKDHGLGDTFARKFLKLIDFQRFEKILAMRFIDSQVSLEEPYQFQGSRRDIDIQMLVLDEDKNECHRVIIENKIRTQSANPTQLNEYYQAVTSDEPEILDFTVIFLTPNKSHNGLAAEFNGLNLSNERHRKYWLLWSSGENCVSSLIKEIISSEMYGEINPINEYMRHTLKAFIRHSSLIKESPTGKAMRVGEDIGEIVDETVIATQYGQYRVVKRDSSQIQAFNLDTGEKEVARHVLAQYIDENEIDIDHEKYNTRAIGKKFFEWKSET